MAAFPDAMDKMTPRLGYLPGHMPWRLCEELYQGRCHRQPQGRRDMLRRSASHHSESSASNQLGVLAVQFCKDNPKARQRVTFLD